MNVNKHAMLAITHLIFEKCVVNKIKPDDLEWQYYNDFPVANCPDHWYDFLLRDLEIDPKDITIQIFRTFDGVDNRSYYYSGGMQIVMFLGPSAGFPLPIGYVITNGVYEAAIEGKPYVFENQSRHKFEGKYYAVNIQSPPSSLSMRINGNG